ncbi:MAG TPA: carboxypeptidase-like regulatory domain-containing protein, partial [Terriglobales bacterium]
MSKFSVTRLVVCLLIICAVAFAQSTTEGAISGTVSDSSGAVVPNATIVVHNNATNAEQTTQSDSSGSFRAGSLRPAVYTVTVTAAGFAPYKAQQVIVNVGTVTDLLPRLNVGSAAETVTVSAEAPQINTTSADFAPVLNNTAISNLPINGGRWSNFVLLTPTVVNDGQGFGLVSFRGMSALLNNNTIDGADNNQAFFSEERGRTRAGYSSAKAAVQEFQVNTSNYSSEYGRSAGGVINTVTKSGTNALHGEMYFYDRDNSWGAMNPFTVITTRDSTGAFVTTPYKPVDVRKISGFAVGGPIKKDKLFFFLAFDWYKRNFPGTAVPSSARTFFVPATKNSSFICL